ncbi:hypothetical protein [Palleronia rufa]|uniref:hypothetical protein n=1 Tax=Palleronia rufa TaxID=1530186 RepID=UPI000566D4BC|nr:hypothetical protein [Palleronia rufa]
MPRTLYLHIGMPKCASSTIQGALKARSGELAGHGLSYAVTDFAGTEGQGNATLLAAHIRSEQIREATAELDQLLAGDQDAILSSEVMVGLARTRNANWLIDNAAARGLETRILCYVRRQDHWIESDFKQHIKGGSDFSDPIRTLIGNRTRSRVLDYHWLLSNWARVAGQENIALVPLCSGQTDTYALEQFVAWTGRDPALAQQLVLPRRNVSPPVALVEPARHLKRVLQRDGKSIAEIQSALRTFLTNAPAMLDLPKRRFILPRQDRQALVAKFADSNARLSADFYDGKPVFDDEFEPDAEGLSALQEENALVLAECAVRMGLFKPAEHVVEPAAAPKRSMSRLMHRVRDQFTQTRG